MKYENKLSTFILVLSTLLYSLTCACLTRHEGKGVKVSNQPQLPEGVGYFTSSKQAIIKCK